MTIRLCSSGAFQTVFWHTAYGDCAEIMRELCTLMPNLCVTQDFLFQSFGGGTKRIFDGIIRGEIRFSYIPSRLDEASAYRKRFSDCVVVAMENEWEDVLDWLRAHSNEVALYCKELQSVDE